eukprot:PhF_6_TR13689/c3_g1_i1/m.22048/K03284/corA; magnesium transporter
MMRKTMPQFMKRVGGLHSRNLSNPFVIQPFTTLSTPSFASSSSSLLNHTPSLLCTQRRWLTESSEREDETKLCNTFCSNSKNPNGPNNSGGDQVAKLHVERYKGKVEWVDISGSNIQDAKLFRTMLKSELKAHNVHSTFIKDAIKPMLLPQCSIAGNCIFFALRWADQTSNSKSGVSIPELSNRFTMLLFPDKVITVHRHDMSAINIIKARWEEKYANAPREYLVNALVRRIIVTFEHTVYESSLMFDRYEASLLLMNNAQRSKFSYQIYDIKRQVSVYHRLLAAAHMSYVQYSRFAGIQLEDAFRQDVVQYLSSVESMADELNQNSTALLQLNFQMAAHHLNELMRILTVVSVLFIPMNFIAAFYGMNFQTLPGLDWEYGWVICVLFMIGFSVLFVAVFHRGGYLAA